MSDSFGNNPNEITIRDIIVILFRFKNIILNKKKMILVTSLVSGAIFLSFAIFSPVTYIAKNTFMTTEEQQISGSRFTKLISQMGFMGAGSVVNADKLVELMQTRRIIEDVLLKKVVINGKNDYFTNHYIEIFNIDKNWDEESKPKKGYRLKTDNRSQLKTIDNIALQSIYEEIKENIIVSSSKQGIVTALFENHSEEFTKYFSCQLVATLSEFYISKSIEQQQNTFNILVSQIDSVKLKLNEAEIKYARFKDESNRLVKAEGFMQELRLKREVEILNTMYVEGIKNLEIAKFTLLDKTPIMQIIDNADFPLEKNKHSKSKLLILGLLIGSFLASLYIILNNIYQEKFKNIAAD